MKDGSFRNWFVHVPRGPAHPGPKLPVILSYQEAGNCPWALRNQGSSSPSESDATLTAPGHQMCSDHQLWETHLKLKNAGEIIRHLNERCSFLQTRQRVAVLFKPESSFRWFKQGEEMASSVFFEANQACGCPQSCCLDSWEEGPCLKGTLESVCLSLGLQAVFKACGVLVGPLGDVLRLEPALWPRGWSWGHLRWHGHG